MPNFELHFSGTSRIVFSCDIWLHSCQPPHIYSVFSCIIRHRLEPGKLSRYIDSLWAVLSRNRIPVGARFSVHVQTGSEAHPASYTMDTVSLQGVKQPGRGVDHRPTSRAEVNVRVELCLYSPLWAFTAYVRAKFAHFLFSL